MKVLIALIGIIVIAGLGLVVFELGGDGNSNTSTLTPTPANGDSLDTTPSPAPTPNITVVDREDPFDAVEAPVVPTIAYGPYLVASDALGGGANSSNQSRVFRTSDDTVALLYHRAVRSVSELQEIVLVHSHDGGQIWHGEIVIGTESPEATYSGVIDSENNLYVAYGREARWGKGGAIKFRKLNYDPASHGWTPGDEHRLVWDWPGRGAGMPILSLTGDRIWLGYLQFANDKYTLFVQYADPDNNGEYPESQWSTPIALVPSLNDMNIQAKLVPYEGGLSLFYTEGPSSTIKWRTLEDAQNNPEDWGEPKSVFEPFGKNELVRFSVAAGENGTIHLVTSGEGVIVSHMVFNGRDWTTPTQLAVSNVYGPSVVSDGRNIWTFWVKKQLSGYSQIQLRRWLDNRYWERTTNSPWTTQFGISNPSVLLYRAVSGSYTDITRYAGTLVSSGSGPSLAEFFERVGDFIYVGNDTQFTVLPLSLTPTNTNDSNALLEYWNGSQWATLPVNSYAHDSNGTNGTVLDGIDESNKLVKFATPLDWQMTEVNGVEKYYLRVNNDAGDALRIKPLFGLEAPIVSTGQSDIIDVLVSEDVSGGAGRKLWYGAISSDAVDTQTAIAEHVHKVTPPNVAQLNLDDDLQPIPLPSGSPRQYLSVEIDRDETFEYQLLDGQLRYIKVLDTDLKFRSEEGVTVWGTATVEVSGPGITPKRAEIPAAYFQAPVKLNGVRVYVELTEDFNDFRLSDGGGTAKAARLMISDARYSLTDLTRYRWPFPGMLWGIGPFQHFYQGLTGTTNSQSHVGHFSQTMPANTPVYAWHDGTIIPSSERGNWQIALANTEDERGPNWHRISPLSELDPETFGAEIKVGEELATLPATSSSPEIIWGEGAIFDWAHVLAEWYMAESTPVIRSYVKDWLVLGPYATEDEIDFGDVDSGEEGEDNTDDEDEFASPLTVEYLPNEAEVNPKAGDFGSRGLSWKRYDNILPGVVNIAEAVSEYPNSGWASINGNGASSVAYLATYVHSPNNREVVFNIGSSDAIKVWVGSRMVFEKDTFTRVNEAGEWSVVPDMEKIPVRLEEGWNRVLIKLNQDITTYRGVQSPQNAWQLTFRVSDPAGRPLPSLSVSPDRDRRFDPVKNFAVLTPANETKIDLARPPERRHGWPETANLGIGEEYIFTMVDGSIRKLKLLSYDTVIPRHLITATVEVEGNGKTETHTLRVSPGGTAVAVNGLRLYAYVWKEANDFTFEKTPAGDFPLPFDKDVGFAVNDANYSLFPDLNDYVYPYDTAFNEGGKYQGFLEPAGESLSRPAHAGVDFAAPDWANLRAIHDGVLWYKEPEDPNADSQAWLSTTNGEKYEDPRTWFWSHLTMLKPAVPNGTFVKKGTVIFEGATATHMGTLGRIFDFGVWPFITELWNYEHFNDFPAPRYWLGLGPYSGDIESNIINSNEDSDLPQSLQPREGSPDKDNNQQWRLVDNQVNSVVRVGDILGPAPYGGHSEQHQDNAVGYNATYIYSTEDYSPNEALLTVGASRDSKVWLNGELVFDSRANDRTPISKANNTGGRFLVTYFDDFDVPVTLRKGWNTLIVKTDQGLAKNEVWLFSGRVGDANGNRLPSITFSTRSINLRAARAGNGSIEINWTRPSHLSTFTDSYRLDVATDAGFNDLVIDNRDLGNVTNYTIEGLENGKEYFIRVKPFNSTDLSGAVNWHFMDAVSTSDPGASPSFESQPNQSASTSPNARLRIISPVQGANAPGDSVTVQFSTSGDLEQISHVLLDLDGDAAVINLRTGNQHRFGGIAPGLHNLKGWLVDAVGNRIENTRVSVSFETLAPSAPGSISWLRTEGNRIVDEFGNTVILRGINIENREWVWEESKSIEFERRAIPVATGAIPGGWGANIVTLAIASGPVNRNDSVYLQNLDELVALTKSNNAYAFLVYRYAEPNDDQPRMPDAEAQAAMAALAERYKNEPGVIYGLQVEPHNVTWGELKPRFTSMVDAIRSKNSKALVVVPGTQFGRMIYHAISDPISRPNIVYKTHPYDSWATIQTDYQLPEVAEKYPVLIGEFGPGSQMNLTDSNLLLQFAEEHGISWIGWLFHDRGCPCLLSNSDTFTPSPYGTLVRTRMREAIEAASQKAINLSLTP